MSVGLCSRWQAMVFACGFLIVASDAAAQTAAPAESPRQGPEGTDAPQPQTQPPPPATPAPGAGPSAEGAAPAAEEGAQEPAAPTSEAEPQQPGTAVAQPTAAAQPGTAVAQPGAAAQPGTGGEQPAAQASTIGQEGAQPSPEPSPEEAFDDSPSPERHRRHRGADQSECDCFGGGFDETDPLITLARGPFSLGINGSLQVLAVPFIQDPMASLEAGSIATTEGFRMRSARLGVAGELPFGFGYEMLLDYGHDGMQLLDANLSFEAHRLARISAGAAKIPFSTIGLLSSRYQSFLDRPYIVRAISPGRALGVSIDGRSHWLSYAAGVFNGGGDYYQGDNNAGMLYSARLAAHPLGPLPAGEVTFPESAVFQVAGSFFYNQDAAGDRFAASGELVFRWDRLTIAGEFLWSTFDPAGAPETGHDVEFGNTERMGWFAQASVFILPGFLAISARYEGQRVVEATEIRDLNDLWAVQGAVNGYLFGGRIKLSLQYEHRHEWFDTQVDNDYLALQLQGRI